jgi:tellurite resistance protein
MSEAANEDVVAFNTEALKLLLQVAWANDELDPKEREFLVKLGKAWSVPSATLDDLLAHLDSGKPFPQPNLALLRTDPAKVMRAAEALISADGVGDAEERAFLEELKTLLGCA